VADLPALASLACAGCGLADLPDHLGAQQPALAALAAADNQLTRLPAGLAAAAALVRLDLHGNRLAALDGSIVGGWDSLAELDLSGNALQVSSAVSSARCTATAMDAPRGTATLRRRLLPGAACRAVPPDPPQDPAAQQQQAAPAAR
jgi:Leucine-rich repeat (LRR) protein